MSEVLQNKLLNYQAQPPDRTWEKINLTLNDEYSGSIGERLYNFQAAPNQDTWNKISLQLQSGAEDAKKVSPISQKRSNLVRYLSAAAILVLIASGIFFFINNRTDSDVATNPIEVPRNSPTKITTPNVNGTGKTLRVSKKLYAVFDCADNATALNSKRCKENIQTLQRKMAAAVVTPTNDFTSVIDMIKTLEKEQ
jgi:hypothetical protein